MTLLFGRATINDRFQSKTDKICNFFEFNCFDILKEILYSRVSLSAHTKFGPNLTRFSWVKSTFQEQGKSYILHGPLAGHNTNYVLIGEDL
jgi:hypothetical protein